ncbi:bacterial regulatory helix-turn-helix s, AraC family protein [Escherichia coli DEC6E]|uniref:helix-turn-helix domain-containing protein n=1 Tax=Escherichia coli TaxID=562 RepID=UPI000250D51E|nr:helix-turn-helix domain-containing protein [Escherichia coli]EGE3724966.1 AraC family transcriptional regulator [Escherichia coli]EHV75088.1 bacterial regulatory helix-turn-helix s, AraC family protein [Escherichia coli DEC6E]EIC1693668.1 helix-turn-helix domain-containing protein [Escherichia coli]HBL5657210.1 helix-turn-helix domain-containing protein [Escherichia coli]
MNIKDNNNQNSNVKKYIVKNYYVAYPTLVNVAKGNVVICNMDNLCCYAISEGVYFLKKGIKVGLSSINSKEKPVFTLIPVPSYVLKTFCGGFDDIRSELGKTRTSDNQNEWIIKAADIIYGDGILRKIETIPQERLNNLHSANIIYSFYYILAHFVTNDSLPNVIRNSSEETLKEKVHNIISNNLDKQWSLTNMAEYLYLSPSSLKRKLQKENTTFSEVCLSARMNAAAKFLRQKKASVQKISQMCGYDNYSYFITVFKRNFNITPKKYMCLFN